MIRILLYTLGILETGWWVNELYRRHKQKTVIVAVEPRWKLLFASAKEIKEVESKWVRRGNKVRRFVPNTFKATQTGFDHVRSGVVDFSRGLRKKEESQT